METCKSGGGLTGRRGDNWKGLEVSTTPGEKDEFLGGTKASRFKKPEPLRSSGAEDSGGVGGKGNAVGKEITVKRRKERPT